MTKIVDVDGRKLYCNFDFESWSIEERIRFLEMAIEKRVNTLLAKIDPRFITSATVVNRRLVIPLKCQDKLNKLKEDSDHETVEFKLKFKEIEDEFFGALETISNK